MTAPTGYVGNISMNQLCIGNYLCGMNHHGDDDMKGLCFIYIKAYFYN
jgi:hypothetical protein